MQALGVIVPLTASSMELAANTEGVNSKVSMRREAKFFMVTGPDLRLLGRLGGWCSSGVGRRSFQLSIARLIDKKDARQCLAPNGLAVCEAWFVVAGTPSGEPSLSGVGRNLARAGRGANTKNTTMGGRTEIRGKSVRIGFQ